MWIVYPETKTVAEHTDTGTIRVLGEDDILSAPDLLPGFDLKVSRLFE